MRDYDTADFCDIWNTEEVVEVTSCESITWNFVLTKAP